MFIKSSAKTHWFHMLLIIGAVIMTVYLIINASQKPFSGFQKHNEATVRELEMANE